MFNLWKVDVSSICNMYLYHEFQNWIEIDLDSCLQKQAMRKYIEMEVTIFVIVYITDGIIHVYQYL